MQREDDELTPEELEEMAKTVEFLTNFSDLTSIPANDPKLFWIN